MNATAPINFDRLIPVFPLPNVVLMPGVFLPLHIFEPRYREMTRDALFDARLISLALLKPGYEPAYHTHRAEIHPIVCIGRILREEQLPDGRYNFLLQGLIRAEITCECHELSYRRAHCKPIPPIPVSPETERCLRDELAGIFATPPLANLAAFADWHNILNCPDLSFSDMIDVLAAAVLPSLEQKYEYLQTPSVSDRMRRLSLALDNIRRGLLKLTPPAPARRKWPPTMTEN